MPDESGADEADAHHHLADDARRRRRIAHRHAGDHVGRGAERDQRVGVQAGLMLVQLPLESDHRAEDDRQDKADGLLVIQVDEVVHGRPVCCCAEMLDRSMCWR